MALTRGTKGPRLLRGAHGRVTKLAAAATLAVSAALVAAGTGAAPAQAVVGGYGVGAQDLSAQLQIWQTPPGQFSAQYTCTGTLISVRWVLTAKHCFDNQNSTYQVYSGFSEYGIGSKSDIDRVVRNPNADAALLHLRNSPAINYVDAIRHYGLRTPPVGTPTKIIGWGATNNGGPATRPNIAQRADGVVGVQSRDYPRPVLTPRNNLLDLYAIQGRPNRGDSGAGVHITGTGSNAGLVCGVNVAGALSPDGSSLSNAERVNWAVSTDSLAGWIASTTGIVSHPFRTCDGNSADPSFDEITDSFRKMALADGVAENFRVMPLGDSITAGFRSTSGNGYRNAMSAVVDPLPGDFDLVGTAAPSGTMSDPQNEGHSGWRIDDIAAITPDVMKKCRPNVVTLMAGTNDLNGNVDVAHAPERLAALVDQVLAADPAVEVLVAKIPASSDSALQSRITAYNDAITPLMESRDRVTLVETGNITTGDMADYLHPNDQGYDKLGRDFALNLDGLFIGDRVHQPAPLPTSCGGTVAAAKGPVGAAPGSAAMTSLGRIADGGGPDPDNSHAAFADITGDGKADYLWVGAGGATTMFTNGGRNPNGGWVWLQRPTPIAGGIGDPGSQVRFADINSDGKADYLTVSPSGAVRAYFNGGPGREGDWIWNPAPYPDQKIAGGIGAPGSTIQFGDINGDGFDDYLSVDENGAVTAYLNGGPRPDGKGWVWDQVAQKVASGVGGPKGSRYQFADINDDGWDDYIVFDGVNGSVHAWLNGGRAPKGGWIWNLQGQIAPGAGAPSKLHTPVLADLDADGRADYLAVNPRGSVNAWLDNGKDTSPVAGWLPVGEVANTSPDLRWADLNGDGLDDYIQVDLKTGAASAYLNGGRKPDGSWIWFPQGQIAGGQCYLFKHCYVEFADMDGDKKADYLVGDYTSGETAIWVNGGPATGGGLIWYPRGTAAISFTLATGTVIQWADLNNDGYADMMMTAPDGITNALQNLGPGANGWTSTNEVVGALGPISRGPSLDHGYIDRFANFDRDGRADLLAIVKDGSVALTHNLGGASNNWFNGVESLVTSGPGASGEQVQFADLNGDGRADYLVVPPTGKITAYLNNGGDNYKTSYFGE